MGRYRDSPAGQSSVYLLAYAVGVTLALVVSLLRDCKPCQTQPAMGPEVSATQKPRTEWSLPAAVLAAPAGSEVCRRAQFLAARSNWPGHTCTNCLKPIQRWQFALDGQGLFQGARVTKEETRQTRAHILQVVNHNVLSLLYTPHSSLSPKLNNALAAGGPGVSMRQNQVLWSQELFHVYGRLMDEGQTVSCPDYPHSAEDVRLAMQTFEARPIDQLKLAVWSSISPWVEVTLMALGGRDIVTVDYNPPVLLTTQPTLKKGSTPASLKTMDLPQVANVYASEGPLFDVIVSFSGIEHDGLGRYGDPVNPYGDFAAMVELWHVLREDGLLLLAIPTVKEDNVVYPKHRLYGPKRLELLFEHFDLLGRVWDGKAVGGGLETAAQDPPIFIETHLTEEMREYLSRGRGTRVETTADGVSDWQHQPVFVLRKKKGAPPA